MESNNSKEDLLEVEPLKEEVRLEGDESWKRWGPYLSERQWGTVREDYSDNGDSWNSFSHAESRSRAYRWGEDGLLGITDNECRLCFSVALWNGKDPILKERLFGLTGPEGNHGEDVKECYYYLDGTPTNSYLKGQYKYPQGAFPYEDLVNVNRSRGTKDLEYELVDTGAFNENRYFDVFTEYAKGSPNDILIRITVHNRGPEKANIHVLPTLWFRNTWSWNGGTVPTDATVKPKLFKVDASTIQTDHEELGAYLFVLDPSEDGQVKHEILFTENETNFKKLYGQENKSAATKDAFHEVVCENKRDSLSSEPTGTKAAFWIQCDLEAGESKVFQCRLVSMEETPSQLFGERYDQLFSERISETNEFYEKRYPPSLNEKQKEVMRQAYAGLIWSKQFYYYDVQTWLDGDNPDVKMSPARLHGRNHDWKHLFAKDVISMPDKWEYDWFAIWDSCFQMIPFIKIDVNFAQEQMLLFLSERYMHANGQLPAYEFNFGDVNPPVNAWAAFQIYQSSGDRLFLARVFNKLLLNFTWWVNRKDKAGKNIFSGGFLGLDNIGVFNRSTKLPTGTGSLEQADGTAWMAFYSVTMLQIALELSIEDPAYEDLATKFFEHFVAINDAMNKLGEKGLWDDEDGFYYDQLKINGMRIPLKVRSMVGIIPLFALGVLKRDNIVKLPGFHKRMEWFIENRDDSEDSIFHVSSGNSIRSDAFKLLALASRKRLVGVLKYVLDENEFLSPYGIRSLSKMHATEPYIYKFADVEYCVNYVPGESDSDMFGGNSNWRGPVWFPLNYLLIESLRKYHYYFGDTLMVECPTGSGIRMNLSEVATELARRLATLFVPNGPEEKRPCHGSDMLYATDPHWKDLVLFYEYFDGDTGRGLGASHQTGWTALVASCLDVIAGPPAPVAK